MERTGIAKPRGKVLLALDLDGTTLNDRRQFSPRTVELLKDLRGGNCVTCFISGRRGVDMTPLGEHARLPDYAVLNTGAQILDVRENRVLWEKLVPRDTAEQVIEYCLEQRCLLNVCAADYWGVSYINGDVEDYARRIHRAAVVFSSPAEVPLDRIEGFTATERGEQTVSFIRSRGMDLYCVQSEPGAYDITPGGISKWTSLQWLAGELGIPRENIIAAGNYLNDLDMIVGAGIGVAVRNALPEVQAAADYVTRRSNNEHALEEIVERFL